MSEDNVVYLDAGRADVARAMEMLNREFQSGNLKAMVLTHWTEDERILFTAVGYQDTAGAVMETVGAMEHHKQFLLNAYNAALIARAQDLEKESDVGRREREPPDEPAA